MLNLDVLKDNGFWEAGGVTLPNYNIKGVTQNTYNEPMWVHFGAGNIFRGFIASLQQKLLNDGLAEKGIVAVEVFDGEIIDRIYRPFDNLVMNVVLNTDGAIDCEILAPITEALRADESMERLTEIFKNPGLQMVSFTITEKAYNPNNGDIMGILAKLLHTRYIAGKKPVAMVSLDNCSKNGDKLRDCILEVTKAIPDDGFIEYINDERLVSFPWTMIDKITPRPDDTVKNYLEKKGIKGMKPILTEKGTYIAPFVNAEKPQYLVIEDKFPNGRPPLEHAGVFFTDRDTVNKTERMKVTTCLNPLHTAMAVFGCLLGYTKICDEMRDEDIVKLIKRLGYDEGLPVVTDPKIINPRSFIDEVVNERLPNRFLPDAPGRITTDTSQKVGIRFGETIKSYVNEGRDLSALVAIPLAIAGWMRYLLGKDDNGADMEVAPDPLKEELQDLLGGIKWNDPASYTGQLLPILSNSDIFGLNLADTPLYTKIEGYFAAMLGGSGAVRETLRENI